MLVTQTSNTVATFMHVIILLCFTFITLNRETFYHGEPYSWFKNFTIKCCVWNTYSVVLHFKKHNFSTDAKDGGEGDAGEGETDADGDEDAGGDDYGKSEKKGKGSKPDVSKAISTIPASKIDEMIKAMNKLNKLFGKKRFKLLFQL